MLEARSRAGQSSSTETRTKRVRRRTLLRRKGSTQGAAAMMREPAPVATWRDLYTLAITRLRGASALMDACAIVIAASGNEALQEAVASRMPGVHTSCWL